MTEVVRPTPLDIRLGYVHKDIARNMQHHSDPVVKSLWSSVYFVTRHAVQEGVATAVAAGSPAELSILVKKELTALEEKEPLTMHSVMSEPADTEVLKQFKGEDPFVIEAGSGSSIPPNPQQELHVARDLYAQLNGGLAHPNFDQARETVALILPQLKIVIPGQHTDANQNLRARLIIAKKLSREAYKTVRPAPPQQEQPLPEATKTVAVYKTTDRTRLDREMAELLGEI